MSTNNWADSHLLSKDWCKKSFWQSSLWENILTETHQAETFWHTYDNQKWLIERRHILKNITALYVLGVPDAEITSAHILRLRELSQKSDIFLQIEPLQFWTKRPEDSSTKAPFRRFLEPVTAILSLENQTADTLLQHFSEKGRYNIRVAGRRWLKSRWVRAEDASLFDLPGKTCAWNKTYAEIFFDLLEETTERDGFSHNSLHYYQTFLRVLENNNAGGLLLTLKDNIIHAAGIFVYWQKQAIYYYGASSNLAQIRRDHGTYFLQWEAIQEALRRNCDTYDFLGISSHIGDKLAGVTTFKMRFSPEKIFLPSEKIIIFRPIIFFLLKWLNKFRKLLRLA